MGTWPTSPGSGVSTPGRSAAISTKGASLHRMLRSVPARAAASGGDLKRYGQWSGPAAAHGLISAGVQRAMTRANRALTAVRHPRPSLSRER